MTKQRVKRRGATINRRDFLKKGAATAVGAAAAPLIIPSSALGANGQTPPSERIVMGCIGVGSQGSSNMRNFLNRGEVQIVAVCDVDKAHRDSAINTIEGKYADAMQKGTYKGCDGYNDFRELIGRGDLDAVSIAVPDHWHAIPAIACARAGLDIYAEKPLALTISQGRAMSDAVRRYRVVWQTGSWQRSVRHFRHACELVRNGRIGKVHTVKVGLPTGPSTDPQPEQPVPEGFDYNFWLGPAPKAPYTKERCHWNFRWILDYSGGQVTDWGAHHCDIAQWGMGTEHTGPVEVVGKGDFPREGLWNAATDYRFEARYAEGFTMIMSNAFPMGARFEGENGWVHVSRGGLTTDPPELKNSEIKPSEIHLYESNDHWGNFLECVRTRRETITPIEVAHRSITIAHLGNIAMRLERKINWDPRSERIIDDPEASAMLDRGMRSPWHC